jgi:two-component system cell cycle response regulator CtrA
VKSGIVNRGPIAINLDAKEVEVQGDLVALSDSEWTVLSTIAEANGEIVTAPMIMGALYGGSSKAAGIKFVDVLVCRLRRKLGVAADLLDVVWGRGYFLADLRRPVRFVWFWCRPGRAAPRVRGGLFRSLCKSRCLCK